ncbi:DNA-methyltransferase [Aeromonas dhakensis]|uniref:DNA-methyltransferase n=1 Tax=Aeromonas dhakensis TaxID=196024 RepID=UPI00244C691B|nr:site-specific DNA-methyltransferase [Aeromonas dhakensis]MDH0348127.1 site-specific DNA-methyltransferase [Aeromonas dhakensis]
MNVSLHNGDCLMVLATMADNSVDSIVTDAPYGLRFMAKKWDYDVPSVAVWLECLRVLKPGGHILAFAGTRTQHRMACNIEDAGFEIRDMVSYLYDTNEAAQALVDSLDPAQLKLLDAAFGRDGMLGWVYGSGMPKSHNLKGDWEGWGTTLKPALEPITLARKPFKGTVAANVRAHGPGALNVAGCRVGGEGGRWPANVCHDGSAEVVSLFPAQAGAAAPVHKRKGDKFRNTFGTFKGNIDELGSTFHGDSGSASRFFYCAKASRQDRHEGMEDPGPQFKHGTTLRQVENAATKGNNHPTVKPTELMRWLCRLITPLGGVVLDPFMGSGSTGKAALLEGFGFIGIEIDAGYYEIAERRVAAAYPIYPNFIVKHERTLTITQEAA